MVQASFFSAEWWPTFAPPHLKEAGHSDDEELGDIMCTEIGNDSLPCLQCFASQNVFLSHLRKQHSLPFKGQVERDLCHESVSLLHVDFCFQAKRDCAFTAGVGPRRNRHV